MVKRFGKETVWSTFTPLAQKCNAVNLGQGFPDVPPPGFVLQAAKDSMLSDHQYAPSRGLLPLLRQLEADYSADLKRSCEAERNVMVTLGANQGIFAALQAFVGVGDAVLLIEPAFDIYRPSIELVGGKVFTTGMHYVGRDDGWTIDFDHLEGVIRDNNVKVIILNTPHNPTGKVYSPDGELKALSLIARKYDLLVISDEVYDRLQYDAVDMYQPRIASLEGMWERTVTVGSAGKRFGVTGWRIGWLVGSERLIDAVLSVHCRTVYSAPTPLQNAVATALEIARGTGYYSAMARDYMEKRDYLAAVLENVGLPCSVPAGGYFILAQTKNIAFGETLPVREWAEHPGRTEPRDYAVARWFTEKIGVAAIPLSAFALGSSADSDTAGWLRFCFCKQSKTLEKAAERLEKVRRFIC